MTRPKSIYIGEPERSIDGSKRFRTVEGKILPKDKDMPAIPHWLAESMASKIVETLRETDSMARISIAGSVRRGKQDIHDIDILVSPFSMLIANRILDMGIVLWSGRDKISIMMEYEYDIGQHTLNGIPTLTAGSIQVDIRFIPPESWGSALQYFTGSREHNISLRSIAKRKGWTLNEHGIFDAKGNRLDDGTEGSMYKTLGLRWLPPRYREGYFGGFKKRHTFADRKERNIP